MYGEECSEDEDAEGRESRDRRSSRTPGLQESDSDNGSREEDGQDTDESDKAIESEEDRATKVNIMMPQVSDNNNYIIADKCGPQLSKRELREEMKSAKRLDVIEPNMKLNPALIARFHKVRI